MELQIVDDYTAMSHAAADRVAAQLAAKPDANIMLATGSTPIGLYKELAVRVARGEIDFSAVTVFQLDDFLGVPADDPRSLYAWLSEHAFVPLGIGDDQVVVLAGDAPDPIAACRSYDAAVAAAGGIDLAVLGIGVNGHIGWNEPPAAADAPSRVVDLTPSSLAGSASAWGGLEHVPPQAIAAGMPVLLGAQTILLIAAGSSKHAIIHATVAGPISPENPASYLQQHANTTVIVDCAAWE